MIPPPPPPAPSSRYAKSVRPRKDAVRFGILVLGAYVAYLLAHLAQGAAVPNGILLSGVIGTLALLAGHRIGRRGTDGP